VLTTGFDAPHVDVIAILRATESVGLLQQIIGRGLRINDGKKDCLILDYAENIERHCPDGDVFTPKIKVKFKSSEAELFEAECPVCNIKNTFSLRINESGFEIDKNGYYIDLDKQRIKTDYGDMPAHYGRRCQAMHPAPGGKLLQCHYRWTGKECPHCLADNDIAARYCSECKGEIVDPNEKLVAEFKALKKDPTRMQTDNVVSWELSQTTSLKGNNCLRVDYTTEYRRFSIWYMPDYPNGKPRKNWDKFQAATNNGVNMPQTITYRKKPDGGLYEALDYGRQADEIPE
jgi:DNA repair protein RadD